MIIPPAFKVGDIVRIKELDDPYLKYLYSGHICEIIKVRELANLAYIQSDSYALKEIKQGASFNVWLHFSNLELLNHKDYQGAIQLLKEKYQKISQGQI